MENAVVGDDVHGEDPTVNALQELVAGLLGMEAGLFVPSGTQSNLVALLTHCGRGDEALVGLAAHVARYEAGGASVLGGIVLHPLVQEVDGSMALDQVQSAIKPKDVHFAKTRLLCLENTWHGRPLALGYLRSIIELARKASLSLHLDGARIFNAAIALHMEARDLAAGFDSVSVCLSKGLGAPVGSVLCSSKPFIDEARRWRKMVGGGMRQAGVLAAAGRVAIEEQVERLAIDHENATRLAKGLRGIPGLVVEGAFTNMVFLHVPERAIAPLGESLARQGVLIDGSENPLRLVTHLDVDAAGIDRALQAFASYFVAERAGASKALN